MYNKRDTYIEIDAKSAPKSHSIVIVGSNHLGEAKTDITMITQWKDANDGTWQSLRTPFDNVADALYYTRKYCNMLARAANEPCLPFCAEIAGLDADGLRDKTVTYYLSECAANELPWRVRVYKNGEPQKAFADFYSLNDAVDYIAEQNNLRVSPDLAMAVSKKNGYTLQAIESQDEDIAAKGVTLVEDFDEKDADGNFIRHAIAAPELTSYNTAELVDCLQDRVESTELEDGAWDITAADVEFRDYKLAVWLHVDVTSRESGEQKILCTYFGLDDPSINHIFWGELGYSNEERNGFTFREIEAMLPEITDKLLHSSAVFEYLKNDFLNRYPSVNAASVNKLYECDPSRKLYPDGIVPDKDVVMSTTKTQSRGLHPKVDGEKEQTKPKKHTTDIDR